MTFHCRFCYRSAEKRKKIEEHYMAEQDLAEARRRKEERVLSKRDEQQKVSISYMCEKYIHFILVIFPYIPVLVYICDIGLLG